MSAIDTLPERPPRQGGLAGPIILIGAGLLFLLNNLGVISWSVWGGLIKLWPLLLIAIGLDLLFGRRSRLGSLLVAALVLAALAGAIWYSGGWGAPAGALLGSQAISQPLGGASSANLDIGMGVGTLRLGAQATPDGLLSGSITAGPRDQVEREFGVTNGVATFRLHSVSQGLGALPIGPASRGELVWDLRLNPSVPLDLKLSTGAGTATLDLSQLTLRSLEMSTGVGAATVTLPRAGVLRANISGGVGETTIAIPAGVAARIKASAGLGQVRVLGTFERQGELYVSPGYAEADARVELTISGGVGSITVTQEPGR
jgi:hypothetical protein